MKLKARCRAEYSVCIQVRVSLPSAANGMIGVRLSTSRAAKKDSPELAMKSKAVRLADVGGGIHATPALAHHSFAMSDSERQR
jgi:hypothetical protein